MTEIVSKGITPTIVSDELITGLKSWAGNGSDIITLQPALRVGAEVEVMAGPLQGMSGTILKEGREGVRITILLSFLQNGAQLNVERTDIRLIA